MPDADDGLDGELGGLYEGDVEEERGGVPRMREASAPSRARAPQEPAGGAVGGLEIEYDLDDFSDDEVLLDWEQYAGMRRVRVCGMDCTRLIEALPCDLPPPWWYRLSKRRRAALTRACSFAGCLGLLVLAILVLSALFGGHGSPAPPSTAPPPPPLAAQPTATWRSPPPPASEGASILPREAPPPPLEVLDLCGWSGFRLPEALVPTAYDLHLDVSALRASGPDEPVAVKGSVAITLQASKAVRCVPLHADVDTMALAIATVREPCNQDPCDDVLHGTVSKSPAFDSSGIVVIDLGEGASAGPGELVVELDFSYALGSSLDGLYMSNFTGAGGLPSRMAVTQFEATAARKAFPCFDEPALKANFSISVTASSEMTVLSNMPEHRSSSAAGAEGAVKHEFKASPPMSTYLVALVVGELTRVSAEVPMHESLASPAVPGNQVRTVSVWGTPGKEQYLEVALDFARAALKKYESLLGVPYALPKMDLVAIPDFSAGAMENWGLITYRETDLLVQADEDSAASIKRVAMVIAHEIAHQWFGNLVTMEFWGDLWLNEGFATYFEHIGASAALEEEFPEMEREAYVWQYFFPDVTARALKHDSLAEATKPLSMDTSSIDSTEQIESFFNPVPYDKGGSVLRMLRAWLARDEGAAFSETDSGDPLIAALSEYLKSHAFRTATSQDLVSSIQPFASKDDVPELLSQWLYNKYAPLIKVDVHDDSDDPAGSVVISQRPIPPIAGECGAETANSQEGTAPWVVPISFLTANSNQASWMLMKDCTHAAALHILEGSLDFVKLNVGEVGLYRVSYSEELWERLIAAAHQSADDGNPVLSHSDLAGLLSDSYNEATHGLADITIPLRLLHSLGGRGRALEPWLVAYDILMDMHKKLKSAPLETSAGCVDGLAAVVRQHILSGFVPMGDSSDPATADNSHIREGADALSLEGAATPGRPYGRRILDPLLLGLAAAFGDQLVPGDAVRELKKRAAAPAGAEGIPGDIRYLVYKLAAISSTEGWESVLELYRSSTSSTEKDQALMALGAASDDPGLVNRTLELAHSDEVRSQDTVRLIKRVGSNGGAALDAAAAFARKHWHHIAEKYSSKTERSHQLGRLFGVAGGFATQERLDWAREWWESSAKVDIGEDFYLDSVVDSIKENMRWMSLNRGSACSWLTNPENSQFR